MVYNHQCDNENERFRIEILHTVALLNSFYICLACLFLLGAYNYIFVSKRSVSESAHMHWRGIPSENPKISVARRLARCATRSGKAMEVVPRYIITSGSNARWTDDYKSDEIKGSTCSASAEHRTPSRWLFVLLA